MSADNYYMIRRHFNGGFVALHGFMSDDYVRVYNKNIDGNLTVYENLEDAVNSVSGEYTEYGTQIHPECYVSAEKPAIGDHVQDGGEWGTIVRCHECGGTGQLHQLDETPLGSEPKESLTPDFMTELQAVLNKHSMENGSNTPDFILAEYLRDCLEAFNLAATRRKRYMAESSPAERTVALAIWDAAEVASQYDYPTSDPALKTLEEILAPYDRPRSVDTGDRRRRYDNEGPEITFKPSEHERRSEAGL